MSRIADSLKYDRDMKDAGLDTLYVEIKLSESGFARFPYDHLHKRPPSMPKKQWNSWVNKIVKLAAQHGGWKLVRGVFDEATGETSYSIVS